MSNFIFGHPGETAAEMRETIRFARKLNSFNVLFTKMLPLPDVDIYQKAVNEGILEKDIWLQYMHGKIDLPVYYPSTIKPGEMEKIHKWAYISYYLSPQQMIKFLPFITNPKFLYRGLAVFFLFIFGKTLYK